ncbi:MAG: [protein-PII] uridylyltransferase [Alphaproteobacteria bacterium]
MMNNIKDTWLQIWQEEIPESAKKAQIVSTIKDELKSHHGKNLEGLETKRINGIDAVRLNSEIVDNVITSLFDFAVLNVFKEYQSLEPMAVMAVGGYGRRELAPFSDIDILFLLPDSHNEVHEQLAMFVLYILWDCGFKIGHSFRSIAESVVDAKQDMVFRTNLLENRLVIGNESLFDNINQEYKAKIIEGTQAQFIKAKLEERENRLKKTGYSRYLLEPDIKDGQGALRDLHLIFWLTKYVFGITEILELVEKKVMSEAMVAMFIKAHIFLSEIRCFLHYYTKRPDNRLNFDMQQKIAEAMGFKSGKNASDVEKFMKAYYLHTKVIGDLTKVVCLNFEEKNSNISEVKTISGFILSNNKLDFDVNEDLASNPLRIFEIFYIAHNQEYKISPRAFQKITENLNLVYTLQQDEQANKCFLDILTSSKNPEKIIRAMSDVGVLGRFMLDFARIIAQMQFDMYHIYTTDEHTIRALGILNNIVYGRIVFDSGKSEDSLKNVREIAQKVHLRKSLSVAMFLHDIAKGRGGDHSEMGAKIAQKLAPRLGLSESDTENVSWLILYHQLMSKTAFQRDIFDEKTIADFVAIVKSPERLRQLYVLTCADIIAVGPDIWTSWKAQLLAELYKRAEEYIQGAASLEFEDKRVAAVKNSLAQKLEDIWGHDYVTKYLSNAYPSYWLGYDEAELIRHAELIKQTEESKNWLGIAFANNKKRNLIDVIVYTADRKGLFSKIAGALSVSGFSIVGAKIMTLANGMVLDSFSIEDLFVYDASVQILEESKQEKIKANIAKAINDEFNIESEIKTKFKSLASQKKTLQKGYNVIVDNNASKTNTVIEVNAEDCYGFLYYITHALTELDLQISSAHIFTYGDRVVDVFYVKDKFGLKIEHNLRIKQIENVLNKELSQI